MLDKALKLIITLTLLFFLLQAVIGVLVRALEAMLRPMAGAIAALGGVLVGLLTLVGMLCLVTGLFVRARQFVLARNPRAAREQATRERAGRTRVRRPAEDAPVHEPEEPASDPDPAINDEETE